MKNRWWIEVVTGVPSLRAQLLRRPRQELDLIAQELCDGLDVADIVSAPNVHERQSWSPLYEPVSNSAVKQLLENAGS